MQVGSLQRQVAFLQLNMLARGSCADLVGLKRMVYLYQHVTQISTGAHPMGVWTNYLPRFLTTGGH